MTLNTGVTFNMILWEIAEQLVYEPAGSTKRIIMTTKNTIKKILLITLARIEVFM